MSKLILALVAFMVLTGCASSGPPKPATVEFNHAKFALWYADTARVYAVREADRIILRVALKQACAAGNAAICVQVKGSDAINAKARKMDAATELTIREAILNPASAAEQGFDMAKMFDLLQRAGAAYLSGGGSEADDLAGLLSGITGK